jgi:F0F1-type ATP synthase assembly protein I
MSLRDRRKKKYGFLKRRFEMKKPSMQVGFGIALGAGIGAAIAVILGSGGAWLAIGIAVGIVIGVAMSKRKAGPALSLPNSSSPLEAVRSDKRSWG